MKISILQIGGLGTILAGLPLSSRAQGNSEWNHFGLNMRTGFNVKARFSEGTFAALPPPPSAGGAVNRQYTDGFVNLDSSGNAGGQTWNWGYRNASQILNGEGTELLLHATGSTGGQSGYKDGDPNVGLGLHYVRDLVHASWGSFGIKLGFGYTPIAVHDDAPMIGGGTENITDAYGLSVVPPQAPYAGSFGGPGPVINSPPISRTITMGSGGGVIQGSHDVDASLYDWRVGPSFEFPVGKGLSIQVGGGVAFGFVDSDFSYNENNGGVTTIGKVNNTGGFIGEYAEVGLSYRVWRGASIYTGAQFQSLGHLDQLTAGHAAHLDMSGTIFYELGLEWNF